MSGKYFLILNYNFDLNKVYIIIFSKIIFLKCLNIA